MRSVAVLGFIGLAANVQSHPSPAAAGQNEADIKFLHKRGVDLSKYSMPQLSHYSPSDKTSINKLVGSIKRRQSYTETASQFVKKTNPKATFRLVRDHYTDSDGVSHARFKQTLFGLDIDNADFNVNIAPDGKVFSFGDNSFKGSLPLLNPLTKRAFKTPVAGLQGAIQTLGLPIQAEKAVAEPKQGQEIYTVKETKGALEDPEARLVYFNRGDQLALAWRLETNVGQNWLLTYVDADNGQDILGVVDYVHDLATYKVFPWGVANPGENIERQVLEDPWSIAASPFTWQGNGLLNSTTTLGNNGVAQSTVLLRPVSLERKFEYAYDPTLDPPTYFEFSATQLFYTANKFHDLFYLFGFTEAAGNFQTENGDKGGKGGDAVVLNTQFPGLNNANFATPPDGRPGIMNMFMFTQSRPLRDSSLDAGVVIHEYTHGLSTRLTGGPDNSGCLSGDESGGMGEGWGDFMGVAAATKTTDTRSVVVNFGNWIINSDKGIRKYPYTTSLTINPHTYAKANQESGVHAVGNVWASILFEVLWNLIDKHGINNLTFPQFDSKGVPTDGRYLSMKLVMSGMALQPCNPNFVQARDAIIDADKLLTNGSNRCELWRGFAKRGLGVGAKFGDVRIEDFAVPAGC